ncbi:MAG: gas vesicle protein [Bacteroidota bacterium]
MGNSSVHLEKEVSLAETLSRVLNKGAVLTGDIIISVADIDLLYIGVNLMVSSVETMKQCQKRSGQSESEFAKDKYDFL